MSLRALFRDATARILGSNWGARITDAESNEPKDTGVQQFAEELAAILSSEKPIELYEPIKVIRRYDGPIFQVVDDPGLGTNPFQQTTRPNGDVTNDTGGSTGGGSTPSGGGSGGGGTSTVIINDNTTSLVIQPPTIGQLYVVTSGIDEGGNIKIAPVNSDGQIDGEEFSVRPAQNLAEVDQ